MKTFNGKVAAAKAAVVIGALSLLIWARPNGPDPGVSGVPEEATCSQSMCHEGTRPSEGGGVVLELSGGGATYTPGTSQTITVRITEPAATRFSVYGFQLTARRADNAKEMAGTFARGDGLYLVCGSLDLTRKTDKPDEGCTGITPLEYISHSAPKTEGVYTVEWTPPPGDVGNIVLYAAANAANGNTTESGDRIYTTNVTLSPQAGGGGPRPSISAAGIVNAFSFRSNLASGEWITLFGENLANTTATWGPFTDSAPTSVAGVRVLINGQPAYISYVSPTQVNALVPTSDALGDVRVEIETPNGVSDAVTMTKMEAAPGLLAPAVFNVDNKQYIAALHADQTFVGKPNLIPGVAFRPAAPGNTIILYGVGFGPTDPPSEAGKIVSGSPRVTLPLQIRIGGSAANVAFAGLVQGLVGLYQFNIVVPNVADGDHELQAEVGGISTGQTLYIMVQR